jgi:hypothetical protein
VAQARGTRGLAYLQVRAAELSTTAMTLNTSAETAVAARNATGTDFRFMPPNIIGISSRLHKKTQLRIFGLWW